MSVGSQLRHRERCKSDLGSPNNAAPSRKRLRNQCKVGALGDPGRFVVLGSHAKVGMHFFAV